MILIEATQPVTECRDPKDDKFLELAVSAKADVLVWSGVHLLEMHPFLGLKKNTQQLFTLFALSILWMVRGKLMEEKG